jgi:ParB-like chromosome segregation protein Spo0J
VGISVVTNYKTEELKPYDTNTRLHGEEQLQQIEKSIKEFGFTIPVLIDESNTILAGHGRWNVAKRMGMEKVPCLKIDHLTDTQKKAYVIADNKIAENSEWNFDVYMAEIKKLDELDFDLTTIGLDADITLGDFSPSEITNLEVNTTTDRDLERARESMNNSIEGIKKDHAEEATEVICPHCNHAFKFTGN